MQYIASFSQDVVKKIEGVQTNEDEQGGQTTTKSRDHSERSNRRSRTV